MSSSPSSSPMESIQTTFEELDRFLMGLSQQRVDLNEILRKAMEGFERVTGEIFRQVRDFDLDPQTIILNLPPFLSHPLTPSSPPPPSPPPVPPMIFHQALFRSIRRRVEDHPVLATGVGFGMVGLVGGLVDAWVQRRGERRRRRREGWMGRVVDGFMVDAILIISPDPHTPLLYPLILTLLKNQYVVLLGLPDLDVVEDVERWLKGLSEGGGIGRKQGGSGRQGMGMVLGQGVWVGVLDCDDPTSVQAFHRSVYAAMTTRYPSVLSSTTAPHSMSSWASGRYGTDRKPVSQKYAPLPRHLPRLRHVFNLYGLGSGGGGRPAAGGGGGGGVGENDERARSKRKERVPPIPMLLRSPTSYSSYVSLGTSAASASAAYVSGSSESKVDSRPGQGEDKDELGLFTFVPTRTSWPIPREFDRQLDTVENLLLGRNALAESSSRAREKRPGEVVRVKRHVEVYVGDLRRALEGLDLRKLLVPRIRARGIRVDWFDRAPSREFWVSDSRGVRMLAPVRLGLDVLWGTASWPWRMLVARVQRTRRESRRRMPWDEVEDALLGEMKRGRWGLGLGVVGLGSSSVWPCILASILPTRLLAFLIKNTSIIDMLPPYLPSTRSYSSSTTPVTPTSASETTDDVPHVRGRDTPKNSQTDPSPERPSSEGTGTGTMPSLGGSFLSSRSTDGMDASWVGVDGSR